MPAGRPPKPTLLKELAGNPGKRPLPRNEPQPPDGEVQPPGWLSDEALEIWREHAPAMIQMRLLTVADASTFALFCAAFAMYRLAQEVIDDEGPTYESINIKTGVVMVRARPEVAIAADAWRRVTVMAVQFGMTPSARGRVQLPSGQKSERDDFDDWEQQRTVS